MGSASLVFLLVSFFISFYVVSASTSTDDDLSKLDALKDVWQNTPPSWVGSDPCGSNWEGIQCTSSRVTYITLLSMGLTGGLSGDISFLSELKILYVFIFDILYLGATSRYWIG